MATSNPCFSLPWRLVRSVLYAWPLTGAPALAYQGPPIIECTDLGICGQWSGPYELCVSCDNLAGFGCGPHCQFCDFDEIGHAGLIPTGTHAGKVLFWTRCDNDGANPGYKSHVWDPQEPSMAPLGIDFPPILSQFGPFCSGPLWILDAGGNPKLLVSGGTGFGSGCFKCDPPTEPANCGANKAIWFNPTTSAWEDNDPGPGDFTHGNWYPAVSLYDTGSAFEPILVGGDKIQAGGCCSQITHWQTFAPFGTGGSWTTFTDASYAWHEYPRLTALTTGQILTFGHAIICEQDALSYGGNPVQLLTKTGSTWTRTEGPNPNPPGLVTVGGWHYANAVVMHTLIPGWSFGNPVPETQYGLDRVLVFGGTKEVTDADATPTIVSAQSATRELLNAPTGPWQTKASAKRARVLSNWVVLPDGSVFLVGGHSQNPSVFGTTAHHHVPELFHPGSPTDLGTWHDLAQPAIVGTHPTTLENYSTFRGYHSLAVLLADGSVAIAGGQLNGAYAESNSADTLEVFKPGYFFNGTRPRITSYPNPATSTIQYDSTFCVTVDIAPANIRNACLIGISSITHHFDYGQRYVELMVSPGASPCGGPDQLAVKAPPLSGMAPAGYYLLFVVDTSGRPSTGRVVKVGY